VLVEKRLNGTYRAVRIANIWGRMSFLFRTVGNQKHDFEAFHTVHSCGQSLLFIPTTCTQYIKYTYLSPIISYMFRCLLHHLQAEHCITWSKSVCFWQCWYKVVL